MLTPEAAAGKALVAARLRRVSGAGRLIDALELPSHCPALHDGIAAAGAFGAALVDHYGSASVVDEILGPALSVLTSLGLMNELRGPSVILTNTLDGRGVLATEAHLCQLEAAVADEAYHLTRVACRLSRHGGFPVLVRLPAHERPSLVAELPPDFPPAMGAFARAAGPHRAGIESRFYHRQKRERRLGLVEELVDLLCVQLGVEGPRAVIVAGHLSPDVQARAWSRRLPSLRLSASWPLPRARLRDFMRGRDRVLVLEEGEPILVDALRAFAHRERMSCAVESTDGPWPQILGADLVESVLSRFGGRVRGEVDAHPRPGSTFTAVREAIDALPDDEDEPWPLYYARASSMARQPDRPSFLVAALRGVSRPTILVAEPSAGIDAGRTVDVEVDTGHAAAVAGALADAAGGLPIAVVGATGFDQLEQAGVFDNALARRELVHVVIAPRTAVASLQGRLSAMGMPVTTAALTDPELSVTVAGVVSKSGPRALVCYGEH